MKKSALTYNTVNLIASIIIIKVLELISISVNNRYISKQLKLFFLNKRKH